MSTNRYDLLFEPIKIGPVIAPNRFYAVPHATGHGHAQPGGAIALRAMKAEGGWGVVSMQITEIAADSDMANHQMERLWSDHDVPAHARQVEAIKAHGALAAIELGHGGMRSRNLISGQPVIGPSALPVLRPEIPIQSRAMDLADIQAFRENHKLAAKRAKTAGYDILYVYAAHDLSILSHFLSLRTNQRTDSYGGSFENRVRLLREVLEDTLEVANGECAVAIRFSVAEPGQYLGLTSDGEGREVVEALAELPDLWDVNISGWSKDSATSRFTDEGFQLPFTDFVKTVTSKPVVGVGRFTSPDTMVSLIKKGRLDLIGAARPSIADPFLPTKIREGRIEEIRECIGCNVCVSMDGYGIPIRCTQNPTISEEWRRDWHPETIPTAHDRKSYLVVGAGPAGLECAWTLLRAGCKVTIAEAEHEAGGRVTREAGLPGLHRWASVRDYRLDQISQSAEADLFLASALTAKDVMEFDAQGVIFATGATWRPDGVGSTNFAPFQMKERLVLTPDDIMGGADIEGDGGIIVYDDEHHYMGSVIAERLRHEAHRVSYVTPLPTVATWTDYTLEQGAIVERLLGLGVKLYVNTKLNAGGTFNDTLTGGSVSVEGSTLVFVGARTPNDELFQECRSTLGPKRAFCIGDGLVPGTIQAAVFSGHKLARQLTSKDGQTELFRRDAVG